MQSNHLGGLILILIGASVLAKNFNFTLFRTFWPLALILLGVVALLQTNSNRVKRNASSTETVWEVEGDSSLFKGIIAVPALFIVFLVGLIILGAIGPFFLLFLLFIPLILFVKIGWAFFRLLIPIAFLAAPLLFVFWILAILF